MKRRDVLAAGAVLAASAWTPLARAARPLAADHRARIQALIGQMTLAEKVGQMNQIAGGRQKSLNSKLDAAMLDRVRKGEMGSFLHVAGAEPLRDLQRVAVEESRLKIPLLFAMDVIHGYRTILPVPLALAASWDPKVAEQAARIAAEEAWAAGLHWTFTPMVDVARDPRWGRVVEGAGEDAYLGSRIAEAQVAGFQGADLAKGVRMMACAKHFVGYGAASGGRDYDSADIGPRTLNEVYLPPFHAAARAGAGSFMTAFNDLDGVPMTAHADLVRGFLRARWNYQGLVVSDWNAIRELVNHGIAADAREAAVLALKAGVDMDMASGSYATYLAEAATADPGLVPLIDEAVGRILAAKARLGLFDDPYGFGDPARDKAPLRRTEARDLARRSVVLLRNEGAVLPLKPDAKLALIGALADDASSAIGSWRARGQAADAVTLKTALAGAEYQPGADIAAAVEAAKRADVVLVAIGEDFDRTGEARSYADIGLPGTQGALLEALKATAKPIVAILMGGRPLALERELTGVPAVLQTWLLGVESGPAIAEILSGKAAPGGRLPIGMPRKTGQSPQSYAHLPTGRPANPDLAVDSARYHDTDIGPLFAFGHGLSYGDIAYGPLTLSAETLAPGGRVTASVQVTNRGTSAAEEVVQLYANDPVAAVSRPVAELRGFARVPLKPGQSRTVRFTLTPEQFAFWRDGTWIVEAGEIRLMVGASSADLRGEAKFHIAAGSEGQVPAASLATKVEIA
ncbi:glycoside hydrolase family 3 N-terminal domain-containing protein [Sphingomonas sp. HT-1]|uniref:glycoside hydrolase family 3 N-terminal domain-containing protein n=1 Tax=unclassified Sphingomonas TaxID=196159 RepID=UPI0002DF1221|nr:MULTISPECIES: glycoside hydrolase family 3 N-terminal domain-containing protein [unclassified Sphingomonas]KTF69475.1 beta-glucosidase [Sphingomonas sp. WG]